MKTLNILVFLTMIVGVKLQKQIICDGVIFHHVYYDKKLVLAKLGRPYNLVFHKFTGMLFFSHTIDNQTTVDFGIMACYLHNGNCSDIQGVDGGYAVAYDSGNDDIYMGGHNGIYKYNFLTKKAEYFAEMGKSIWGLFIRRNFYYIDYPTQKLYVYKGDKFVRVAEAMNIELDHFIVSKHGDIYFSNKTALYKVTRPGKDVIMLNDEIAVRQISEDNYGDVYFCAYDGIYVEDKPYHRVKKCIAIDQCFGLAFDVDNHIIYSDKHSVYRLLPSPHGSVCYSAIKTHFENQGNHPDHKSIIGISLYQKKKK